MSKAAMRDGFAYGVDYGWVSQLERQGVVWVNDKNEKIDPIQAAIDFGTNAIRLRVFVDPPEEAYWDKSEKETCMLGYCDKQSVLRMSKRAKAAGLKLMIDIHYSDHFADPMIQDIPAAWKGEDFAGMKQKVAEHTKDVLQLLSDNDIAPDWVQVGNEINYGILWPIGSLKENPLQLVELLNTGYDAVKEVFPACPVIVHVSGLPITDAYQAFFDNFFTNGGKTDIVGFSYYPYWYKLMYRGRDVYGKQEMYQEIERIYFKYRKPVMICEIGEAEEEPEKTRELLRNSIEALKNLPGHSGLGIFYWEPEVGAALLPDRYPLGAAQLKDEKTLCFTEAMKGYQDAQIKGVENE